MKMEGMSKEEKDGHQLCSSTGSGEERDMREKGQ